MIKKKVNGEQKEKCPKRPKNIQGSTREKYNLIIIPLYVKGIKV
jgi:hypothetical protein